MKYISQPPLLLNVHMHNPTVSVRSWMDSLLAFFPGLQVRNFYTRNLICSQMRNCDGSCVFLFSFILQVLRGDLKPAIETHEMLYQVTKQHKFLPEVKSFSWQLLILFRLNSKKDFHRQGNIYFPR